MAASKAVVGGFLLLGTTTMLWWLALAANTAVLPSVPWFVLVDIGALYATVRYLKRHDISSGRLGRSTLTRQSLAFGASGLVACWCLGIVEGAVAGIQVGPITGIPGVSPLVSNIAVLLLPVYAAVSEELTFRGIVQSNLERFAKPHWAIVIATILYLSVHIQRVDFSGQWIFLLCLSIFLGMVAARFGSLVLCIILHATGNLIFMTVAWGLGPFRMGEITLMAMILIAMLGVTCAGLAIKIVGWTSATRNVAT